MIKNHPHWNEDDWDSISEFAQPPIDELEREDQELTKIGKGRLDDQRSDDDFLIPYAGLSVTLDKGEKPLGDLAGRIARHGQRLDGHDNHLGGHDQTLDGHTRTIDGHGGRIDGHDTYLGGHDDHLQRHDREIAETKTTLLGRITDGLAQLGARLGQTIAEIADSVSKLFNKTEILDQKVEGERQARELEVNRQAFALAKDIDDSQYYAVGYLNNDMPSFGGDATTHANVDWRYLPITEGFAKGCHSHNGGLMIDKKGFWRISTKILFGGGQKESDWIYEAYVIVAKPNSNFSINGTAGGGGYGGEGDLGGSGYGGRFRRPPPPVFGNVNPNNSPYYFARAEDIVAMSFLRYYASEISAVGSSRYNLEVSLADTFCINIPAPGYTVYVIFRGGGVKAGAGSTVITMDMIDTSVFERVKERIPNEG